MPTPPPPQPESANPPAKKGKGKGKSVLTPEERRDRRSAAMQKWWRELPEEKKKERADNHSVKMRNRWKNMPLEEASELLGKLAAASKAAHAAPVAPETTRQTVREMMGRPRYAWMASTSTATTPLAGAAALSARPKAPQQGSGSRAPQTPGPGTSQPAAPGHHMTPSPAQSRGR